MTIGFSFAALDNAAHELRETAEVLTSLYIGQDSTPLPVADRRTNLPPTTTWDLHNETLEGVGLECLRLAVSIEHVRQLLAENEQRLTSIWTDNWQGDQT